MVFVPGLGSLVVTIVAETLMLMLGSHEYVVLWWGSVTTSHRGISHNHVMNLWPPVFLGKTSWLWSIIIAVLLLLVIV